MSASSKQLYQSMLKAMSPAEAKPDQIRYDREFIIDRHMISRDENLKSSNKFSIINSAMDLSPNSTMKPVEITPANVVTLQAVIQNGEGVSEGKFVICRSLAPSYKVNAIQFVVDDPDGDVAVDLLLYNHPNESIPTGTIFALMNPYFKLTKAGYMALRCDNPIAHFEILEADQPILANISWKQPLSWPSEVPNYDNMDLNKAGIRCFEERDYERAAKLFTKALQSSDLDQTKLASLLTNRSASYIALELPALALKDAERGLEMEPDNFKLQIRKAHALLDLGHHDECIQFITTIQARGAASYLDGIMVEAKRALKEAKSGKYDYCLMHQQAKKNAYLQSHANFFASDLVEVKEVEGYGRGLVAKKEIEPNTLIIAEKAFAFDVEDNSKGLIFGVDPAKHRASLGSSRLLAKICAKIKRNPSLGVELYRLLAGTEMGYLDLSVDEANAKPVDVTRIKEILFVNAIETGQSKEASIQLAGLWIRPSYINHSCVDVNCVGQFLGDFMFVRTAKKVQQGEQLLFPYCCDEDFKDRDHNLRIARGFICKCRLCELERNEPETVHEEMSAIRQRYFQITKDYLEEKLTVDPAPELEDLLNKCWALRPGEKVLNLLALRIAKTVAMMCMTKEKMDLIVEALSAYEELSIMTEALDAAAGIEMCHDVLGNTELVKPWRLKVKKLAKIMLGDERLLTINNQNNAQ